MLPPIRVAAHRRPSRSFYAGRWAATPSPTTWPGLPAKSHARAPMCGRLGQSPTAASTARRCRTAPSAWSASRCAVRPQTIAARPPQTGCSGPSSAAVSTCRRCMLWAPPWIMADMLWKRSGASFHNSINNLSTRWRVPGHIILCLESSVCRSFLRKVPSAMLVRQLLVSHYTLCVHDRRRMVIRATTRSCTLAPPVAAATAATRRPGGLKAPAGATGPW